MRRMFGLRAGLAAALAVFALFAGPLIVHDAWLRLAVLTLGALFAGWGLLRLRRREQPRRD